MGITNLAASVSSKGNALPDCNVLPVGQAVSRGAVECRVSIDGAGLSLNDLVVECCAGQHRQSEGKQSRESHLSY